MLCGAVFVQAHGARRLAQLVIVSLLYAILLHVVVADVFDNRDILRAAHRR